MSEPDNTRTTGPSPSADGSAAQGVRGADADRLDSPGAGSGVPGAGADGEIAAREDLRQSLGERAETAGREDGGDLEQNG